MRILEIKEEIEQLKKQIDGIDPQTGRVKTVEANLRKWQMFSKTDPELLRFVSKFKTNDCECFKIIIWYYIFPLTDFRERRLKTLNFLKL